MLYEGKIRRLIANSKGQAHANACQIWKGYGDNGQAPHGWWVRPFNENARPLGSNWKDVRESWEGGE